MNGTKEQKQHARIAQRRVLIVALLLVGFLASANSLLNPLFEPPDELLHYQFVRHLVDERSLPVQDLDGDVSQSHQPPLYYLGGALLVRGIPDPQTPPQRNPFWAYYAAGEVSQDNKLQFLNLEEYAFPYEGTALVVHVLRFWSVALVLATVAAMWLLGQTLWPNNPAKVALMLAIGTLNPMFLYIGGAVNNDNMVILWGAILLWLALRALQNGFTWLTTIWIGLAWGVSLLSKLNGLVLLAPWSLALVWLSWRKRDWRLFLSRSTVIMVIALALAGWWFSRNLLIYGDPTALKPMLAVWGGRTPEQLTLARFWLEGQYLWTTFWGRFGYGQVPFPDAIYAFYLGFSALALAGGLSWLVKQRRTSLSWRSSPWLVMGAVVIAYGMALLYFMVRNPTGANGRYVFPALPAAAAIMTAAITVWLSSWKRASLVYYAVATMIAGIAVYSVFFFLPQTYARPALLTETQAAVKFERPADAIWGGSFELLGTAVSPREVMAGESVSVTACWHSRDTVTTNYALYVRLLDHKYASLGQRDTYPGLGRFPTSFWRPGDIFCDTYPVRVTREIAAPVVADIDLGFYDLESGDSLRAATKSGVPIEQVVVDRIKILPAITAAIPKPQHTLAAKFAQGVSLVGYNWSAATAQANESISVDLIWAASGPLDRSYTVFAHLLDANGELISQADSLPRDGTYPTNFWADGDRIIDRHRFMLPPELEAGPTTLRVGLYLLEDLSRLPRLPGAEYPDRVELSGPTLLEDSQ